MKTALCKPKDSVPADGTSLAAVEANINDATHRIATDDVPRHLEPFGGRSPYRLPR